MTVALSGQAAQKFEEPDLSAFGKAKAVKVPKQAGGAVTVIRRKSSTSSTMPPIFNQPPFDQPPFDTGLPIPQPEPPPQQ
jgi:hypothetical protein